MPANCNSPIVWYLSTKTRPHHISFRVKTYCTMLLIAHQHKRTAYESRNTHPAAFNTSPSTLRSGNTHPRNQFWRLCDEIPLCKTNPLQEKKPLYLYTNRDWQTHKNLTPLSDLHTMNHSSRGTWHMKEEQNEKDYLSSLRTTARNRVSYRTSKNPKRK